MQQWKKNKEPYWPVTPYIRKYSAQLAVYMNFCLGIVCVWLLRNFLPKNIHQALPKTIINTDIGNQMKLGKK